MKLTGLALALLSASAVVTSTIPAEARPAAARKHVAKRFLKKLADPKTLPDPKTRGSQARVAYSKAGEMRPTRDVQGRRPEPLTAEEDAAAEIQKLLRGPFLRRGITGLFVADARTGQPLFSVNATDPVNPASNVKLISTATALELLGPEFRYPTRILGPAPVNGVVKGDVYLLGSYDPTLTTVDMHEIAATMARAGITSIEGSIAVGSDPTRDGIYRAVVPIEITAGEPGQPPTATVPANFDLVDVKVVATTHKRARKPRLTYKTEITKTEQGYPRITLTIGGVLGKGSATMYPLWTRQRTATAAYSLISALRAHSINITGEMKVTELGDFIGDSVLSGALPIELGRHESRPLADIVARVNKWSVNWLADRVVMTAAALGRHQQPSMELAIEEMYSWLARHPHIAKPGTIIDTGSGLSYRTQITTQDLVSVIRAGGGYLGGGDAKLSAAWLRSLSIAGNDGTLRSRFRNTNAQGHIVGKTGTLSTAIALAGILDIDPARPLAFALVTNTDAPLSKAYVRKAHEKVIGEICKYLVKTAAPTATAPVPALPLPSTSVNDGNDLEPELEETSGAPDAVLDAETARSK